MPTQLSMEMGLFRIKETVINKPDGSVLITRTPKITGKGQLYFVNYFLNGKEAATCRMRYRLITQGLRSLEMGGKGRSRDKDPKSHWRR